jgi:hypothetical protein
MKKFLLSVFMAAFTLQLVSAQSAKTTPPPKAPAPHNRTTQTEALAPQIVGAAG